ncbi:MAG: efflux RND transporter periplasmic adaptor subunit, partial [Cyanobium sp.]
MDRPDDTREQDHGAPANPVDAADPGRKPPPTRPGTGRRSLPATRLLQALPGPWRPVLLLIPIAAALVLRGLQNSATAPPPRRPPLVATAAVTVGRMDLRHPVMAEVRPLVTVEVRPEVDGTIQRVFFEEGTVVVQGQPLALINPTPYRAALDQARANTSRAGARLGEAQAQERLAEAQLGLAATRARRYSGLSRQGALSRDDEENYLTQERVARANLAAQRGGVASARADLNAARAAEAVARLNLERTVVRAPIGGRIGQQRITLGNLVRGQENRPLVVINQTSPLDVVFAIPQQWEERVRPGLALDLDGHPDLRGRVVSLDNTTNANTGTVMVKARLRGDTSGLTSGESLSGSLLLRVLEQALLVPGKAVQRGQRGPFVYAARSGRAVVVPVTVLGSDRGLTAVRADLRPGEPVVVA